MNNILTNIKEDKKKIVVFAFLGMFLGLAGAFVVPEKYESTAMVQTRNLNTMSAASEFAALVGANISKEGTSTADYIERMKSSRVLDPIIDKLDFDNKEKPKVEEFAKHYLKINKIDQTNLITIKSTAKKPEDAQMITSNIIDNFLEMQTENNKQTQSLMVKFLNENIDGAKNEADEASQKFAEYQKEHKIYNPEEQAKVAINIMSDYDKAISDMEVQKKSNQAKSDSISAQLTDIGASSIDYQVNDNGLVQDLRMKYVEKELSYIESTSKYTDNHPEVIRIKKELDEIKVSIEKEINAVVGSKYMSINPAQAALIKEKLTADFMISTAETTESTIKKQQAEKEEKLEKYPNDVLEYMKLKRDAEIKNEVYISLVKQCEENKIKEAMESMDVQVIDEADLPQEPVFPNKKLFMMSGLILGLIMAGIYELLKVKRKIIIK